MIRLASFAAVAALSSGPGVSAPARTVIANVHVLTLDERGVIDGAVVLRGDQIERVLGRGEPPPRDATVVDGAGGYLIPGLIDAHVHFESEKQLAAYLRYGVTTVLSLGDPEDLMAPLLAARRRQAAGEIIGAHLYATGPTIANHVRIETVAAVEPFLDRLQSQGFEFVKTYNEIPQDVFDAVVAGARRRGLASSATCRAISRRSTRCRTA